MRRITLLDQSRCNLVLLMLNLKYDLPNKNRFSSLFRRRNLSKSHCKNVYFRKSLRSVNSAYNTKCSPVALQLRAPPKVSARAPAHRSYHFRGVKLKCCIKKIHHNLYISKQANIRIKHADSEGASHKKFGTDARVQ